MGAFACFIFGSQKIFNPYQYRPIKKVYKASPDYVNGTVIFYERNERNTINNL